MNDAEPVNFEKQTIITYMNLQVVTRYLLRYDPSVDIASEKAFRHVFYHLRWFPWVDMGILFSIYHPFP